MTVRGIPAAAVLALVLSGCGLFQDTLFFGEDDPPLPGERVAVLALAGELEPDAAIADLAVALPPPAPNAAWAQLGGVPSHAPGHPALDGALTPAWSTGIGTGASSVRRLPAPPVIADGRVFALDAAGSVAALDAATGRRLWRVRVATPEEDSAALGGGIGYAGGLLYVTTGFGEILAIDPVNGGMVWRTTVGGPVRSAPTVDGGRVFAVTIENELVALDAATGEVLWTHTGIIEDAGLLGAASPAAEGGVVIAPYSSGELFALRAETGRPIWSDSLAAVRRVGALASLGDIRGLPVIDRGLVLATSHGGRTAGIDLRTGARAWDQEIGGIHMPWVAGDFLFMLTNDAEVVALTRAGGRVRWVTPLERWRRPDERVGLITWAGPVLAGGRLILVNSEGRAVTLDPATGAVVGGFALRGATTLPPVVAEGTLYVLSDRAELTAYR